MVKRKLTKTRKQEKEDKMFIGITPEMTSGGGGLEIIKHSLVITLQDVANYCSKPVWMFGK